MKQRCKYIHNLSEILIELFAHARSQVLQQSNRKSLIAWCELAILVLNCMLNQSNDCLGMPLNFITAQYIDTCIQNQNCTSAIWSHWAKIFKFIKYFFTQGQRSKPTTKPNDYDLHQTTKIIYNCLRILAWCFIF